MLSDPLFSNSPFGEYRAWEMIAGAIEHPNLFQIDRSALTSIAGVNARLINSR